MKTIIIILLLFVMAGCTSYYKVTDPSTEKVYYTKKISYKSGGAVELMDAKSGAKVVLPASEVKKIEKEVFNQGVYSN